MSATSGYWNDQGCSVPGNGSRRASSWSTTAGSSFSKTSSAGPMGEPGASGTDCQANGSGGAQHQLPVRPGAVGHRHGTEPGGEAEEPSHRFRRTGEERGEEHGEVGHGGERGVQYRGGPVAVGL